jgi:hypothetical protein
VAAVDTVSEIYVRSCVNPAVAPISRCSLPIPSDMPSCVFGASVVGVPGEETTGLTSVPFSKGLRFEDEDELFLPPFAKRGPTLWLCCAARDRTCLLTSTLSSALKLRNISLLGSTIGVP